MSDVGDVNAAHSRPLMDPLTLYIQAAEKMMTANPTVNDHLGFHALHKAGNVVKLGELIAKLRAENSALLDQLYGDQE